ncbi:MAG: helix-turn-helix domain-containing protein [Monoglobales bacterium]
MKILIVDDETPIREWIQFSIERGNNPDFNIVAVAENGNDALDLALKYQVDVVIADIKMPGIDGIELMKQVLKKMPYTSFVILTNYAEFSYAREAVTYGAKKYLLKSELRGRDILRTLEEIQEYYWNVVKDKKMDFYSNGYLDIFECYYNLEDKAFQRQFWTCHGFHEEENFLIIALEERDNKKQKHLIENFLSQYEIHGVGPALKNENIFLLIQSSHVEELKKYVTIFARLYENQGFMVSGHIQRGIDCIMKAIDESEKMLRYRFLITNGYLSIEDVERILPLDRYELKKESHKIMNSILYEEKEKLLSRLELWFNKLRSSSFEDIDWVKEMCLQMVIRVEEIGGQYIAGFSEEHKPDMQWTLESCKEFCFNLIKRMYSIGNLCYSQSIRDTIRYIHQNYNRDISLNEAASYIYRSPEYLSRLFKAETGENFSSYLTKYRLKKAKELLLNTDMKIYEIADAVGYTTPSYFSKMYKDYMGIAPETTRSQKNNRM